MTGLLLHIEYLNRGAVLLLFLLLHLASGALMRGRGLYRPVLWRVLEKAAEAYEFRLNRGTSALVMRGVFVAVFLGLAGLALGIAVWRFTYYPFGWLGELLLLLAGVSVLGPIQLLRDVAAKLEAKDATMAAALLVPYTDDDLTQADPHKLARRALEFGAGGFCRYFVAPLFYYALGGGIALSLYIALLSLFGAAGRPGEFGRAARGIEKVGDYIPARVTALLVALAAIATPQANPAAGLGIPLEQSSRFLPRNCGWTIGAVAGALGIALGGPQRFKDGSFLDNGWLGNKAATARLGAVDVKRGAMLMFIGFLCFLVLFSASIMAAFRFS